MSDGMTEEMLQLGRVAYERWVEGMEGVIRPAGTNRIFGLPPWSNWTSVNGGWELPQEQKELWARVAISARADAYAAGLEQGRRQASGVRINGEAWIAAMEAYDREGQHSAGISAALKAAVKTAGLTVIE